MFWSRVVVVPSRGAQIVCWLDSRRLQKEAVFDRGLVHLQVGGIGLDYGFAEMIEKREEYIGLGFAVCFGHRADVLVDDGLGRSI